MRWLLLLLIPSVLGLGIAPADSAIDISDPQSVQFRLYNTEGKTQTIVISMNGTLAEYLSFDQVVRMESDERVKELTINVSSPEKPGTYKATISAESSSVVRSSLTGTVKGNTPTGMITADESSGFIWPAVLILIIVANIFFLSTRKTSENPAEKALKKLKRMDQARFQKAVNSEQNLIADELEQQAPELAFRIYDITNKRQMMHEIEAHLQQKPHKKSREELEKEMKELKHELDTFDFTGFEKDL